jgi:D-alanyl-D-alanine-carboxypeptidase/D-alanyl-D-alanine-endopeptidase
MHLKLTTALLLSATACSTSPTPPDKPEPEPDNDALVAVLQHRVRNDRTGVCMTAAVIEGDTVQRATVCADDDEHRLDGTVALEIGSVTKTMNAALLASLVRDGVLALDDRLVDHLPPDVVVPVFNGQPIQLRHLVTHTSGLPSIPSRLSPTDPEDPWASLSNDDLLASLADVELEHAPGAHWEYSNFAVMLLSYVVTSAAGDDFEGVAHDRIFAPLGMQHTWVNAAPDDVEVAVGHIGTGEASSPWHFAPALAGVGGVRATLDDMVRYAQANLGHGDADTVALLQATHAPIDLGDAQSDGPEMGMGWIRGSFGDRTILMHDGGTGGFSSFVGIEPDADRAVVVLADNDLINVGGVSDVAAYLLGLQEEQPAARVVTDTDEAVLAALVGDYRIADVDVSLLARDATLVAVLPDGSELEFGFDSAGDFFPLGLDAVLVPTLDDGQQTFLWVQAGVATAAQRVSP